MEAKHCQFSHIKQLQIVLDSGRYCFSVTGANMWRTDGQARVHATSRQSKKNAFAHQNLISCIGFSFLLPEHESCIKGEADERFGGAHTVKFRFIFLIFTLE